MKLGYTPFTRKDESTRSIPFCNYSGKVPGKMNPQECLLIQYHKKPCVSFCNELKKCNDFDYHGTNGFCEKANIGLRYLSKCPDLDNSQGVMA
jgi:hypothetical protein